MKCYGNQGKEVSGHMNPAFCSPLTFEPVLLPSPACQPPGFVGEDGTPSELAIQAW